MTRTSTLRLLNSIVLLLNKRTSKQTQNKHVLFIDFAINVKNTFAWPRQISISFTGMESIDNNDKTSKIVILIFGKCNFFGSLTVTLWLIKRAQQFYKTTTNETNKREKNKISHLNILKYIISHLRVAASVRPCFSFSLFPIFPFFFPFQQVITVPLLDNSSSK